MHLRPDLEITSSNVERGKRALVHDGAWAIIVGTLTGGVLLAGHALALDASYQVIGILAAIPFLSSSRSFRRWA